MPATERLKGVAINLGAPHHLDHLAPMCEITEIPFLFIEEKLYEAARHYYPHVQSHLVPYEELTPEYLIRHYDVIFMSDYWDRKTFRQQYQSLEEKYHKTMRQVHCPHGFSDKGFYLMLCAYEDIALVYGQNMLDQFKHFGVYDELHSYVLTGNYRYTYFQQQRDFWMPLVEKEVFSRFARQQPTILYAPTWRDSEDSTSLFSAHASLLGQLPDHYNMVVKLHPLIEEVDPIEYYKLLGLYEDKGNILFVKDFHPVYPLLAKADLYIGDMSSISYDFLIFNKPMFFLNTNARDSQNDRGLYIFRCGVEILPEQFLQLYQLIESSLPHDAKRFAQVRRETYAYTFGRERSFAEIRADVIKACNAPDKFVSAM